MPFPDGIRIGISPTRELQWPAESVFIFENTVKKHAPVRCCDGNRQHEHPSREENHTPFLLKNRLEIKNGNISPSFIGKENVVMKRNLIVCVILLFVGLQPCLGQNAVKTKNDDAVDETRQFKDIKAKADKGDVEAQCWLAICYNTGLYGCKIDLSQSQELFQKVAKHSNENLVQSRLIGLRKFSEIC